MSELLDEINRYNDIKKIGTRKNGLEIISISEFEKLNNQTAYISKYFKKRVIKLV